MSARRESAGGRPRGRGRRAVLLECRVLLVEGDDEVAELVERKLARVPRSAFVVERVDRLELALRRGPAAADVVLLDLELPDSAGLSTFQRTAAELAETPVVVISSAGGDQELAARAVRRGADAYVAVRRTGAAAFAQSIRSAIEGRRVVNELRRRAARLGLALRAADCGIWDWDLTTDSVHYSARWRSLLGYPEVDRSAGPELWLDLVHCDDLPGVRRLLDECRAGRRESLECEYRMLGAAGEYLWVRNRGVVVRAPGGTVRRITGACSDITRRRLSEARLVHDAFHDCLTGLANRALFADRVERALAALKRGKAGEFAILYLDLDHFKRVNDSLGHAAGDTVLIEVARRLERSVRPGDSVARLGGDEFAILVSNADEATSAIHLAERLLTSLPRPGEAVGGELAVTASIGITVSSVGYLSAEEMIHDADLAMYRAKSAGRARYQVFDPDMHRSAMALLKMESELRSAVEREAFVMHYQPIVSLASGHLVGFEGLVRWDHPERGLVPPARFLAVAEETRLIVPIGWWALAAACRQMKAWQDRFPSEPPLFVSVNVSGRLVLEPDMVERLRVLLDETGLAPWSLRLEVIEEVVLAHDREVTRTIDELRAAGIAVSIDDFGTGYSSLSYLGRLRYDALKIDPSCVHDVGHDRESSVAVRTILGVAETLGIGVIAEGIETAEQATQLRRLGCPEGQGFWFARPLSVPAAERLIVESPSRWVTGEPPGSVS